MLPYRASLQGRGGRGQFYGLRVGHLENHNQNIVRYSSSKDFRLLYVACSMERWRNFITNVKWFIYHHTERWAVQQVWGVTFSFLRTVVFFAPSQYLASLGRDPRPWWGSGLCRGRPRFLPVLHAELTQGQLGLHPFLSAFCTFFQKWLGLWY